MYKTIIFLLVSIFWFFYINLEINIFFKYEEFLNQKSEAKRFDAQRLTDVWTQASHEGHYNQQNNNQTIPTN